MKVQNPQPNQGHRRGFTLIEMLVVVGILLVLLSLGGPTYRYSIRLAHQAGCLSNMHQLSLAWVQYPIDHGDRIVIGNPNGGYNPEKFVQSGSGPGPIKAGALWPYMSHIKAWQCPAAPEGEFPLPGDTSAGNTRTYTLTGVMRGEGWTGGSQRGTDHFGRIINPAAQLIWMEEYDRRGWNIGSWLLPSNETGKWRWIDYLAPFHGVQDSQNLSFADGHAELWTWTDTRSLDNAIDRRSFFLYAPDNDDWARLRRVYRQLPEYGNSSNPSQWVRFYPLWGESLD